MYISYNCDGFYNNSLRIYFNFRSIIIRPSGWSWYMFNCGGLQELWLWLFTRLQIMIVIMGSNGLLFVGVTRDDLHRCWHLFGVKIEAQWKIIQKKQYFNNQVNLWSSTVLSFKSSTKPTLIMPLYKLQKLVPLFPLQS